MAWDVSRSPEVEPCASGTRQSPPTTRRPHPRIRPWLSPWPGPNMTSCLPETPPGTLHLTDPVSGHDLAEPVRVDDGAVLALCSLPGRPTRLAAAGRSGSITILEQTSNTLRIERILRTRHNAIRTLCHPSRQPGPRPAPTDNQPALIRTHRQRCHHHTIHSSRTRNDGMPRGFPTLAADPRHVACDPAASRTHRRTGCTLQQSGAGSAEMSANGRHSSRCTLAQPLSVTSIEGHPDIGAYLSQRLG
jgi:hypothetical protein